MLRIYIVYSPMKFFMMLGMVFLLPGMFLGGRFLWFWLHGAGQGKIQSLILMSILMFISVFSFIMAFIGDLLSVNRRLLEDLQYNQRKQARKN